MSYISKNEVGNSYGRLKVLRHVDQDRHGNYMWLCECACGKQLVVAGHNLRKGNTLSCGCLQRERTSQSNGHELAGKVFGKLTVIDRNSYKHGKERDVFWNCICSCGNKTSVRARCLISGGTKSCGCLKEDPGGEYAIDMAVNQLIREYSSGAKKRGYTFNIRFDKVRHLVLQRCAYCGSPPNRRGKRTGKLVLLSGLDRVDNSIGYEENNVVPCCKYCNWMKHKLTADDFLLHAKKITAYQNSFNGV